MFKYTPGPVKAPPMIGPCSDELAARLAGLVNFDAMRAELALPIAPGGPWIAGGSLLRTALHGTFGDADVDVFCANQGQVNTLRAGLERYGYDKSSWSIKSRTPVGLINVITRSYPTLAEVLLDFDYTVCQFGFDGEDLYVGGTTEADLAARQLVPVSVRSAARQFNRLAKYIARGFTPTVAARDVLFRAVSEGLLSVADEDGSGERYEF